jgi:hypothetical protein
VDTIKITKALTIQEPWVSLILTCGKDVENRTWAIPPQCLNQWIAVHASKKVDRDACNLYAISPEPTRLGAVVGAVKFIDCHQNWQCSDWAEYGKYHWIIDRRKLILYEPIPCRGQLGLWDCDLSLTDYKVQVDLEKGGRIA